MDEIIKKYATDVKRFCMSLCHDAYLAEELTQETFYRTRVKLVERIKIPCDIILDLLPLYVDDVCSEVSREEMERHLKTCPNCLKNINK